MTHTRHEPPKSTEEQKQPDSNVPASSFISRLFTALRGLFIKSPATYDVNTMKIQKGTIDQFQEPAGHKMEFNSKKPTHAHLRDIFSTNSDAIHKEDKTEKTDTLNAESTEIFNTTELQGPINQFDIPQDHTIKLEMQKVKKKESEKMSLQEIVKRFSAKIQESKSDVESDKTNTDVSSTGKKSDTQHGNDEDSSESRQGFHR